MLRVVAGLVLTATSLAPAAAAVAAEGGTPRIAAAAPPTLVSPADGATLTTFGPNLTWTNPANATQVHVQVIPANNDGPGVNLYFGSAVSSLQIPPPPEWYGLLPGMTYTWRVRASDATTGVGLEDASWSTVAERKFKTPSVDSSVISLKSPNHGNFTLSRTPTFQWESSRKDVFYWEVQVSKDPTFELDPAKATAMVYNVLLHGGVTNPPNSYAIPAGFPLEEGTVYYWRARPRVQGDGTPVAWSKAALFRVVAPGFRAAVTLGNGPASALEISTVGPDGASLRTATVGESPYWAPGGKRMILASGEATGGSPEVYVANADEHDVPRSALRGNRPLRCAPRWLGPPQPDLGRDPAGRERQLGP